jgi:hypothetical protein
MKLQIESEGKSLSLSVSDGLMDVGIGGKRNQAVTLPIIDAVRSLRRISHRYDDIAIGIVGSEKVLNSRDNAGKVLAFMELDNDHYYQIQGFCMDVEVTENAQSLTRLKAAIETFIAELDRYPNWGGQVNKAIAETRYQVQKLARNIGE